MADSTGKLDTRPFTWLGRLPIYATTILAFLQVVGMVLTVFLESAGIDTMTMLGFSPDAFWKKAHLWQLATHPFIGLPSFFYVFGIFCTYWFGVGVETYLGRRVLFRLLFLLCLVPALVASAWWKAGDQLTIGGGLEIYAGLFVAYATLYPNAEWWNWITMKWLAFAGIVLQSLMYFPAHRWDLLTVFLSACAIAHFYTRYEQGHWALPRFRWPRRKPALRVLPRPAARGSSAEFETRPEDGFTSEVDALLEKIARTGLASLSAKERARLDLAREQLLKKEQK